MNDFRSNANKKAAQCRLMLFFNAAADISLRASAEEVRFGHPCGRLIMDALRGGGDALAEHMLTMRGMEGEYRLNGAGLKLWWHWESGKGETGHLALSVGGDQESCYPKTAPELKKLIADNRWGKGDR